MTEMYDKNKATSAEEAAKIVPRAEFRVFGQGIIDIVKAENVGCRGRTAEGPSYAAGNLFPFREDQRSEREGA